MAAVISPLQHIDVCESTEIKTQLWEMGTIKNRVWTGTEIRFVASTQIICSTIAVHNKGWSRELDWNTKIYNSVP